MTDWAALDPAGAAQVEAMLRSIGATDAHVAAVLADPGDSLPADLLFRARAVLSPADVAGQAAVPLDDLVRWYRLLGVDISDVDAVMCSEAEVGFVALLAAVEDGFLPAAERDDLLRVCGVMLGRMAESLITTYIQAVEGRLHDRQADPVDFYASTLVGLEAADQLRRGLAEVLTHHFRDAVMRQRQSQVGIESRLYYRCAVGFVDLTGFTALSRTLTASELSALVREFEGRAFEVASASGGRVVKHIGDEVMFTAPTADEAAALALGLVAGFADERVRPRGGVAWGNLLTRGGDYYGPVVNLASRLADEAVPGEVLGEDELVAALAGGASAEPAGRRVLKGFDDPVRVWSLAPAAP